MEITGQQEIIFPMMIAALTAHLVARLIMPTSLYHLLIQRSFYQKKPAVTRIERAASAGESP